MKYKTLNIFSPSTIYNCLTYLSAHIENHREYYKHLIQLSNIISHSKEEKLIIFDCIFLFTLCILSLFVFSLFPFCSGKFLFSVSHLFSASLSVFLVFLYVRMYWFPPYSRSLFSPDIDFYIDGPFLSAIEEKSMPFPSFFHGFMENRLSLTLFFTFCQGIIFSACFQGVVFSLIFLMFDYDVSWHGFLCVCHAFGLLILIYNFRPFDKFAKFLSIISSNRFFNPTHFLFSWNFEDTHVRHFILISQFPEIIFIFIFLGSFLCVFW